MTNYNERLDEILTTCDFEPEYFNSRICKWCGGRKGAEIHTVKQALTSLYKELVAEAKPARAVISDDEMGIDRARKSAANHAIDQFEQNLLKALEALE